MAENELLDIGNLRRWRLTRAAIANPTGSAIEVADCAALEFDKAQRQIASALRKGDVLLALLKAAKGTKAEQQAVIASLKEKQLGNTVLRSTKLSGTDDPAKVAATTAQVCVQQVIDQILLRAGREANFRTPEARAVLAEALKERFAEPEKILCATLEASMRGEPIRRIPRIALPTRPRPDAKTIISMSLTPNTSEGPRAR